MDGRQRSPLVSLPQKSEGKPASRVGLTIGIVILAIVVMALIVAVIVLLLRKQKVKPQCTVNSDCSGGKLCSNNVCVTCIHPPDSPDVTNVSVVTNDVTLTWTAVPGATSYKIYRKLEDPSVGAGNNHQVQTSSGTSVTFNDLAYGTHYFVVTAVNDCGESQPSVPSSLAPICPFIPATPVAPGVVQTTDDCAGTTNSDIVSVSFADLNILNGVYVVRGSGQKGTVNDYLYLVQGNSWGPATGIHLKCGAVATGHTVTQITDVQNAPLTVSGPAFSGTTFTMTWTQVAGSEEYLVFLVGVDNVTGTPHFYGNYAPGSSNSLTLDTNSGDTLVFGLVLGFRVCNRSAPSPAANYVTSP